VAANRVFSGHCRIEAMAGDGQALLLDGLRVHLDLQLESEVTAPMPAAAGSGRQPEATATELAAPRRTRGKAPATPAYQQWAVLAALTSLLLALASWWVGGEPSHPAVEPAEPTSSVASEPQHAAATAAQISVPPAVTAAAEPPVVVVPAPVPPPAVAAPQASSAATAAAGTPRPARPAPGSHARPPSSTAGGAQHTALATATGATVRREEARAAAPPRSANADLLDLFGDTK
jgi:hypothetical protein